MMMFVGSLRDASIRMAELRGSDWPLRPSLFRRVLFISHYNPRAAEVIVER